MGLIVQHPGTDAEEGEQGEDDHHNEGDSEGLLPGRRHRDLCGESPPHHAQDGDEDDYLQQVHLRALIA